MPKDLGAIYTPEGHAQLLATWAIRSKNDCVLDMGVGPGVFVHHAYTRLLSLGAGKDTASRQVYGAEINKVIFDEFMTRAKNQDLDFCNIRNSDFFEVDFPKMDAVIGNPPYVRRRGMDKAVLQKIRDKTICNNPELSAEDISNLSDLYVYFLLYALSFLKPGGRLATLIADSWQDTRYGKILKHILINGYELDQIISFDRSVFEDAQVKSVILLATKKQKIKPYVIRFCRVRNGMDIRELSSFVFNKNTQSTIDIVVRDIQSNTLSPNSPWGSIYKSTTLFDEIIQRNNVCDIGDIASVQIGLETLAKDFFVIPHSQKVGGLIEEKYLYPFAYSVYDFNNPVINPTDIPQEYVFYCSEQKRDLLNTKALDYINKGENTEVTIRGTGITIIGYQNKDRIRKDKRPNWYDVKTKWSSKVNGEILLPRFIYKDYVVLWNNAQYIPGGAVVRFLPKEDVITRKVDIRAYLSILTSSFAEVAFRVNAQIYGGGTSNLRISAIINTPIVDITQVDPEQERSLVQGYEYYRQTNDKVLINNTVSTILRLTKDEIIEIDRLLFELRNIAEVAKKPAHPQLTSAYTDLHRSDGFGE